MLDEVMARWRDHKFVVCVEGQWRLEAFVAHFKYLNEMVAAVDGTTPAALPPHCFDPVQIARYFRLPPDAFDSQKLPTSEDHHQPGSMLSIEQVAAYLSCSYGEARNRMLDGRIRAVKDGRWCRSRLEWVEEYVEQQTVRPESPAPEEIPVVPQPRRKARVKVKAGGVAHKFLQKRKE